MGMGVGDGAESEDSEELWLATINMLTNKRVEWHAVRHKNDAKPTLLLLPEQQSASAQGDNE